MLYHNFQKQPTNEQPKKMNMLVKLGRGGVNYTNKRLKIAKRKFNIYNQ